MKKKRVIVDLQHLQEIGGGTGSYDRYSAEQDGEESVLANPDSLPEQPTSPSTPQMLMGEAILHLQGRQKEVYLSIMRDDKSLAETAEMLGVGKSTVQTYLDRAIAFITAYCTQAMKQERV